MWKWLDICLHCELNSWMFLIKLKIAVFFLLKLRLLYVVDSLAEMSESMIFWLMKMPENIIFWLRLLRVFLYDMRLSAVNLIFNWVITCNDSTWIKSSVSESMLLIWQLYYLSALISTAVASLLTRIDIKSLICQNVDLFSTKIELELLFCVDVDQNCLKFDSWNFSMFLWYFSFYFIII